MLQLLKESVSSRHAERLEQIVVALIGIEIGNFIVHFVRLKMGSCWFGLVLGIITILVDLMA